MEPTCVRAPPVDTAGICGRTLQGRLPRWSLRLDVGFSPHDGCAKQRQGISLREAKARASRVQALESDDH